MAGKKLHPSVEQFKSFIKEHPGLIKLVRSNEYTWQELYEDWYLLGEDDPKWAKYTKEKSTSFQAGEEKTEEKRWVHQLTEMFKKMDANQMQHHINNLSHAIGAIQGVLSQFQGNDQEAAASSSHEAPRNPFSFRKD